MNVKAESVGVACAPVAQSAQCPLAELLSRDDSGFKAPALRGLFADFS